MEFCKGELVICNAGREKDRLMCVTEFDGKYVYVCDGKERLLNNPKRKNPKHIVKTNKLISQDMFLTDRALRKALSKEG
ncbi:MAG: KOW domain-containing RNA-binding protein [Clostridia bacterium]|nr:KOW domain-containing RNA-binding protein [Clostridia bacterium]